MLAGELLETMLQVGGVSSNMEGIAFELHREFGYRATGNVLQTDSSSIESFRLRIQPHFVGGD